MALTIRETRALVRCARLIADVSRAASAGADGRADRFAIEVAAERLENALAAEGLEA